MLVIVMETALRWNQYVVMMMLMLVVDESLITRDACAYMDMDLILVAERGNERFQ